MIAVRSQLPSETIRRGADRAEGDLHEAMAKTPETFADNDMVCAALCDMCDLVTRESGCSVWARPCLSTGAANHWWEIMWRDDEGLEYCLASGTYLELMWLWEQGPEEMHRRLLSFVTRGPSAGPLVGDMPPEFKQAVMEMVLEADRDADAPLPEPAAWRMPGMPRVTVGEAGKSAQRPHEGEWWRDVAEAMAPFQGVPVPDLGDEDDEEENPREEAAPDEGCPDGERVPLECHPEAREPAKAEPEPMSRKRAIELVEEHLTYSGWKLFHRLFDGCPRVETALFAVRGPELLLVSVSVPGDGVTLRNRLAGLEYDLSAIRSLYGDGFVAGARGELFIVDDESVLRAGRLEWDLVLDRWYSEEDDHVHEGGMPDWDAEPDDDDPFWEVPTTPVRRLDRHEVFDIHVPAPQGACDCGCGCCDDDMPFFDERCGCWG